MEGRVGCRNAKAPVIGYRCAISLGDAPARQRLGELLLDLDDSGISAEPDVLALLTQLLLDEDGGEFADRLASKLDGCGMDRGWRSVQAARRLLGLGDVVGAEAAARAALETMPEDPMAHFLLARALSEQQRFDAAEGKAGLPSHTGPRCRASIACWRVCWSGAVTWRGRWSAPRWRWNCGLGRRPSGATWRSCTGAPAGMTTPLSSCGGRTAARHSEGAAPGSWRMGGR